MKMPQRINWNLVLIVFLIGFSTGAILGQWYGRENIRQYWKKGDMRQHAMDRFNRKLQLTPEQQKQVAAIFEAKHPQMLALQQEVKPKFDAIRQSARSEIRQILNPNQQQKFDEMNARKEAWREERTKFFSL